MAEYDMNRNAGHTKEDNERKVTKVITGKAKTKPNEVRKVTSMLISDDASNVKSYVIRDVLIPTFKKTILDVVDMILFGGEGGSKRSRNDSRPPYRSYYEDRDRHERRARPGNVFDYDDITFDSRGDAELVLDQMREMVDRESGYGLVTVADMYDMAGLSVPYTARNYGWFNLRTAEVMRGHDGYYLKLPRAMPID